MSTEPVFILPAEYLGEAESPGGVLRIGGLEVPVWCGSVSVFVRRASDDLSIMEVHIARHDGLAQEQLDQENMEADRYPLGPKEYWRSKMVGSFQYGTDGHRMTEEEFEADWAGD
jgi:hypothetical protein